MLCCDRVKVLENVLPVVDGGQVLGAVEVNVQLPDVDPEVDQEGDTVEVTLGRGQVQGSVAIVIVLLWLTSVNLYFCNFYVKTKASNAHPLPTRSLSASRFPSKAAHRVGVMPSSSLELQSFLVASFKASRYPSRAALDNKYNQQRYQANGE